MKKMATHNLQDDGCDVSPHCLECPLPECKYVDASYYQQWLRRSQRERIETLWNEGYTYKEIADKEGICPTTVFRRLQKKTGS